MTFALAVPRPVQIPNGRGLGNTLARPQVIRLLTPAPVRGNDLAGVGEESTAYDNTNKAMAALASTINAGTKFYVERQDMKSATSAANTAQAQAAAARQAADLQVHADAEARRIAMIEAAKGGGMPSWALPAIIGGVALLGLGAFFLLRKKNG